MSVCNPARRAGHKTANMATILMDTIRLEADLDCKPFRGRARLQPTKAAYGPADLAPAVGPSRLEARQGPSPAMRPCESRGAWLPWQSKALFTKFASEVGMPLTTALLLQRWPIQFSPRRGRHSRGSGRTMASNAKSNSMIEQGPPSPGICGDS